MCGRKAANVIITNHEDFIATIFVGSRDGSGVWVWAGTQKKIGKKYRGNMAQPILKIFISFPPQKLQPSLINMSMDSL